MEAALLLMAEGRSFGSLGLREVTRAAGVVPTAFYRHFRDLEELGLALVEESGLTLRRLLREARRGDLPTSDLIRNSVRRYVDYLDSHRLQLSFLAGERLGGTPAIRGAIRNEVMHFSAELATDLRAIGLLPQLSAMMLDRVCTLVVNTMLNAAGDLLDRTPGASAQRSELEAALVDQLRLIFLGASVWRSDRSPDASAQPAEDGPS